MGARRPVSGARRARVGPASGTMRDMLTRPCLSVLVVAAACGSPPPTAAPTPPPPAPVASTTPRPAQPTPAPRPTRPPGVKQYDAATLFKNVSVLAAGFSHDGAKALASMNSSGVLNLYAIPTSGGEPQRLTTSN